MTIAQTILSQIGGNKFRAMTGAKNFVALDNGLQFSFAGGKHCVITLDPSDTYTVETFKLRKFERAAVKSAQMVYADRLQATFTEQTGLYTSL